MPIPKKTSEILIICILSFAFGFNSVVKASDYEEKLKNAKEYKIGINLSIVVMEYSNVTDEEEVGFKSYDVYKKKGKSPAIFRAWLMNVSNNSINVNPLNFKIVTKNGYTIPLSTYTFAASNPFPATSLEPNTKIDGFIVFELGMEDKVLKIIYDDQQGSRVERDYDDALVLGMEYKFKKLKIK